MADVTRAVYFGSAAALALCCMLWVCLTVVAFGPISTPLERALTAGAAQLLIGAAAWGIAALLARRGACDNTDTLLRYRRGAGLV